MDASAVFSAVDQLNDTDFIEWAIPNVAFRPQLLGQVIPNDTYFPDQWHLNNTGQSGGTPDADINAPGAWEFVTGDPNIIVAVLDDGVDVSHPDLVANFVQGHDFVNDDNDPNAIGDDAHGTACAGLIAAQGNNGMGVTGVAWNCKVMPIKIVEGEDFILEADIATAIRWSANNGADILSNSWGGDFTMPTIHSAIIDVTEPGGIGREGKGCIVLFASGNWESGGPVTWPAKYREVIAVGATDANDNVWYYSGRGPQLDIVAPSGDMELNGDIWTTDIVGGAGFNSRNPSILDYTDKMGGTSAACPIAAGVTALVLSINPDLMNTEVQEILQISAIDLGSSDFDYTYGHGRIDAKGAVIQAATKQQWVMHYHGSNVTGLAVDDLYNVYVTGYSNGEYNMDYATIKYNADGNELWVRRYNSPTNYNDRANALAVDSVGNVYVTGFSWYDGTSSAYTTIKYNSDGNELWIVRYDGPDSDVASALAVDESSNVYVTGTSDAGYHDDYVTVKYDSDGNELWTARYNYPNNNDRAKALAVDGSGNVYVTGESDGGFYAREDFATIKYDPNGNQLWVARYNYNETSDNRDMPTALAVDNYGNVYVSGYTYHFSTNSDWVTIKYDHNGNKLWEKLYDSPDHKGDYAYALALDKLGNVYVTGLSGFSSTRYSDSDYTVIKYDPNGNELWVRHYNSPENYHDSAASLAVDDSGNVYVTGGSLGIYSDFATIKYDSDGNKIWVRRYSGSVRDLDSAKKLVLDDLGNVYVAGYSSGNGYATIKYTQQNYCIQAIDCDLNGDCKIDFVDFAILANEWLVVSFLSDLEELCDAWLECNLAYKGDCW